MNPRINERRYRRGRLRLVLSVVALLPGTALAYIGPGAGLSLIGSVLAFLAAIVVAVFGFLFFPIRRMLRKRKQKAAAEKDAAGVRARNPDHSDSVEPPMPEREAGSDQK